MEREKKEDEESSRCLQGKCHRQVTKGSKDLVNPSGTRL